MLLVPPLAQQESDLGVEAGGRRQARAVLSQSSYYSNDDLRLHFGLGSATKDDVVEVRWPSGAVEVLHEVRGKQRLVVSEGEAQQQRPK